MANKSFEATIEFHGFVYDNNGGIDCASMMNPYTDEFYCVDVEIYEMIMSCMLYGRITDEWVVVGINKRNNMEYIVPKELADEGWGKA